MTNTEILQHATGIAAKKELNFKEIIDKKLTKGKGAIMALMPAHVNKEALMRTALVLASKKEFEGCDPNTFLISYAAAAQMGLQPNTPLGHCYLLPFHRDIKKGNEWVKIKEVQLMLGYKGMIDIARRSDQIESINAFIVYKDDEFNVELGLNPIIKHIPNLNGSRSDDDISFVYAVAKLKGGGTQFEYLTMADVAKARKASRANTTGSFSPWVNYFGEMCRKTAIRKLFKYLPVSLEMANLMAKDEKSDALAEGIEFDDDNVIDMVANDITQAVGE